MGIHQALFIAAPSTPAPTGQFTLDLKYVRADGTLISTNPVSISGTGDSSLTTGTAINMLASNKVSGLGNYIIATATNFVPPISYDWSLYLYNADNFSFSQTGGIIDQGVVTTTTNTATVYTSSPGTGDVVTRTVTVSVRAVDARGYVSSRLISLNDTLYVDSNVSLPEAQLLSQVNLFSPGTAAANIKLTDQGYLIYDSYILGSGAFNISHPTFWATPRPIPDATLYEARLTQLTGDAITGSPLNTWISLNNSPEWGLSATTGYLFDAASKSATAKIEIRRTIDSVIISTSTAIAFSANMTAYYYTGGGGGVTRPRAPNALY